MAVVFQSHWPVAVAGTMDDHDQNLRRLWGVAHTLVSGSVVFHWTHDGTPTGTRLGSPDATMVFVIAQDPSESGAWGQIGVYGPIVEDGGASERDLYMHRTNWDATGFGCHQTRIYSGGPDQNGLVGGMASGREVYAYLFTTD